MPVTIGASRVVRIAARGDGVTEDGRHIPLVAPGDRIGPNGDVDPGPHHRVPPCRHFPKCGGCQLQQLDDAAYTRFLIDRVHGVLDQQGLATEIRPPHLSPPRTRRRATLHAERRGRQVLLGFTEQASHRLVDLAQCEVLHPDLFALVSPLRGLLGTMLPRGRRAQVQLTITDQGVDVALAGVVADGLSQAEGITAFAQAHSLARLTIDEGLGPETRWEPDPVTVTLGGVPVAMPPGAFLQATVEGEHALVAEAREIVGDAARIADLFAGLGTFALAMRPEAKVYAAEAAREAVLSLKSAGGRAGRAIFADHRDLYRRPLTTEEASRFDAILLDPPRAGAREQVEQLAHATTARVAYISCNPNTLARDAKKLCEGGYRLDWVRPVGQFRWSTHVELAACFTR